MRPHKSIILIFILILTVMLVGNNAGAVTKDQLKKYLKDLPGWEAEKAQAMSLEQRNFKVITVSRNYKNKDKNLYATITYGQTPHNVMASNLPKQFRMETDEELVVTRTINGKPVSIMYDKRSNSGTITVIINPKVTLVVNYDKMNWQDALALTKKFDWKSLDSIK